MELSELGYDDWCLTHYRDLIQPGFHIARVTRVDKNRYLVRNETNEVTAELTGKLLYSLEESQELPSVGDWVVVQYYDDNLLAIIHNVLPRKSYLRRKASGDKSTYQIIVSNIDVALIIQALDSNFNIRRLERYISMTKEGNVEAIILLSKSDLLTEIEIDEKISEIRNSNIDSKILAFHNQTDVGYRKLLEILEPGKTYCLVGSSGVGKTTLLNNLLGKDLFDTQAVRDKDNRGKHTTTRRQLSILENGALLIDTPGMKELGLMTTDSIEQSFSEISKIAEECRFEDCTHILEPGCAILKAIESGELDQEKYKAYLKLKKETEFHELSYLERKNKDKSLGRLIKTTIQHKKKQQGL